ncbi:MAG: hypothetical protein MUD12_00590 [Spirochaetes bacterium]|nr:hypothetical protein [Spirochaetota bacterium]
MKKIRIAIIPAILAAALLTSCITAPVCMTSSNTPIAGKKITENLGKTSGSSSATVILGLVMIDKPDIDEAIKEALKNKEGSTALINVKCYETTKWFILFTINSVTVEGEAVILAEVKEKEKEKKK